MKEFIRKNYSYLMVLFLFYVFVPLFANKTGSMMLSLLFLLPLVILWLSFLFSKANGFKWYHSLIIGILWLPTIYLFYNETALIYVFIYTAVSFVGQIIGSFSKKI